MKNYLVLLVIILTARSYAQSITKNCYPAISLYKLRNMTELVRQQYFSKIPYYSIVLESIKLEDTFLQTQPVIFSLFNDRYFRRYKLQYNSTLLACPPSSLALEAILVHEFEHVNDYHQAKIGELITLVAKYMSSKEFIRTYERVTDLKACAKGKSQGLKEYSEWQLQFLVKNN